MFKVEALRLVELVSRYPATEISPMLNIGSGTLDFRTREQPWIEQVLVAGLRGHGIELIHVDARSGTGIDLRVDLFEPADVAQVIARKPRAILCTNVLEHIEDLHRFCDALSALLEPGGYLFVTVPRSYPYHRDPIDTEFRPTPQEIAALFPAFRTLHCEIQPTESYWYKLRERPWLIFRQIFRAPFPFLGFTKWKRSMQKLMWLFTPYKQSIFIGIKT
jgi:hypothetical protein